MSDFVVVRVKRSLKAETFRLYKHITPAIRYMQRSLRERGAQAQLLGFDWKGGKDGAAG